MRRRTPAISVSKITRCSSLVFPQQGASQPSTAYLITSHCLFVAGPACRRTQLGDCVQTRRIAPRASCCEAVSFQFVILSQIGSPRRSSNYVSTVGQFFTFGNRFSRNHSRYRRRTRFSRDGLSRHTHELVKEFHICSFLQWPPSQTSSSHGREDDLRVTLCYIRSRRSLRTPRTRCPLTWQHISSRHLRGRRPRDQDRGGPCLLLAQCHLVFQVPIIDTSRRGCTHQRSRCQVCVASTASSHTCPA